MIYHTQCFLSCGFVCNSQHDFSRYDEGKMNKNMLISLSFSVLCSNRLAMDVWDPNVTAVE